MLQKSFKMMMKIQPLWSVSILIKNKYSHKKREQCLNMYNGMHSSESKYTLTKTLSNVNKLIIYLHFAPTYRELFQNKVILTKNNFLHQQGHEYEVCSKSNQPFSL